jgi:hypothetical protein
MPRRIRTKTPSKSTIKKKPKGKKPQTTRPKKSAIKEKAHTRASSKIEEKEN